MYLLYWKHRKKLVLAVSLLVAYLFVYSAMAGADPLKQQLLSSIHTNDALLVTVDGKALLSKHPEKKLVPASILKVLTSLMSFHYLGSDFRFKTHFYIDTRDNLIVKGFGDPMITSEVLPWISAAISQRLQSKRLNDIIIDNTYFQNTSIPGVSTDNVGQPYNAPLSATSLNFNSVNFIQTRQGKILSAEPQTPLIPFAENKIRKTHLKKGRMIFSQEESPLYFGHMLGHYLAQHQINITGSVRTGRLAATLLTPLYIYSSQLSLEEIVTGLLEFSNNFIANQLFLTVGAHTLGPPATLEKSRKAMSLFLKKHLKLSNISIKEGSGISRKNRLNARQMDIILTAFRPFKHLMKRNNTIFYKTGTLDGISTRTGYIDIHDQSFQYTILLNSGTQTARSIETKVYRYLLSIVESGDSQYHNQ